MSKIKCVKVSFGVEFQIIDSTLTCVPEIFLQMINSYCKVSACEAHVELCIISILLMGYARILINLPNW